MSRHLWSVLAYVLATFLTQAGSHFGVNAEHYRAVTYLRGEPIFPLGVLAMLLQGIALSYLYSLVPVRRGPLLHAIGFAWLSGVILVSYIALAEAAKYRVPAIGPWIAVEASSGFVQFTVYGLLLGLIQRRSSRLGANGQAHFRTPS